LNLKRYAVFLGLVLVGVVAGYTLAYIVSTQPVFVPAGHLSVADEVLVTDTTASQPLTLKYMGGVFSISLSGLNEFPPGQTYQYSRWEFDLKGQVQAFMVVAGPGADGKTFGMEISRKCWDALSIMLPGGVNFVFPAITATATVSPGYVSFEFIPS
jgi:hypothetical protein